MNTIIDEWFLIPLITPFILVIGSLIFKRNLPKSINSLYGYRTPSSMKNQATWDEANKFCANIFFNFSVSASFLFFLIGLFFQNYLKSLFKDITIFNVTCLLITLIPMVLIVIVGTESHLKKIFDSQGNKKNTENQ